MRAILESVAAGALSPEEATRRIGQLPPPALAADEEPPTRIVVRGGAQRLVIVGDPTVDTAVAEGPHQWRREGTDLVVSSPVAETGYATEPPRSALLNWLSQVIDRVGGTLTVRVNPKLPVHALMVGGSLDLSGVEAGASVGVEAGSAVVHDGSGPLTLEVVSGSAKVDWTFSGESSVRVDMGPANILVRPESDVSITAEATLGQAIVKAHDGIRKAQADTPTDPVTVGAGSGTLTAISRMGSLQVTIA